MKGSIKANTTDKYLRPIRQQIVDLVEAETTVVEFGCGNGDLLFKLSDKIKAGIGIDKSAPLISYALKIKEIRNITNLKFKVGDLVKEPYDDAKKDYAISSLLFHILTREEALKLLEKQISASHTTIVCGFSKPENLQQRILLWLDQRFTSHYKNFKSYKKNGFTKEMLSSIKNIKYQTIDTFDPVIKIYIVTKCA